MTTRHRPVHFDPTHTKRLRKTLLLCLPSLPAAPCASADFRLGGDELVHTVPTETALATPDLRDPATVWTRMFDAAQNGAPSWICDG